MSNISSHWCRDVVSGALAKAESTSGPSGAAVAPGASYNPAAVLMRPPPPAQQQQQYQAYSMHQAQNKAGGTPGYSLGAGASSFAASGSSGASTSTSTAAVPSAYAAHMTPEAYQAYMQQYYQSFYS
jgi:hypothetical protein